MIRDMGWALRDMVLALRPIIVSPIDLPGSYLVPSHNRVEQCIYPA
jgi:hypothetical protein